MKPELLFLAGGVFACAAALFAMAGFMERSRGEGPTIGVLICAVIAVFCMAGGIDAWNKIKKGGP